MSGQSREIILGNIRKALNESKVAMPFPDADKKSEFFVPAQDSPEEHFATEFSKLGGKFVYCANDHDLLQQLTALADTMNWKRLHSKDHFLLQHFSEMGSDLLESAGDMQDLEVGISLCECLVARTGSLILSSAQESGRALPVYAPIHIAVAFTQQLAWDIVDGLNMIRNKYQGKLPSLLSLTTGPSRTADIEKTLVVGVHGPKEVYVFLVDEQWNAD